MSDPDIKVIEEIRKKVNEAKSPSSSKSSSSELSKDRIGGAKTPDWKNESEVKDYLDNLFTEYSFQCMSERLPDGCHRLANFLENIRHQYKEATELYKKTCDEMKYGRSCLVYARQKSLGRGCKQDLAEACRYSLLCCDAYNLTEGCLNTGICMSEGVGQTPVNVSKGAGYLNKACQSGNSIACLKLFRIYIEGMGDVRRNPERALENSTKACELGDMLGCMNASLMYRKGDGIQQDSIKAEEYFEKAEQIRRETDSFRERVGVTFGEQHRL